MYMKKIRFNKKEKKLLSDLWIGVYSPHAPADGTTWDYPRCGDCFCTIQEVHTHNGQSLSEIKQALQLFDQ